MDFSQTEFNEEEIPLEYDTSGIDRRVELQKRIDPTNENEKILPTYWQQIKNSYNQSKLVDYWFSEKDQYRKELIKQMDEVGLKDKDREDILYYKGYAQQDEDMFRNLYDNGSWSYDYETDTLSFNDEKGRALRDRTIMPDWAFRGYAKSRMHENLDEKYLRDKSAIDTRKEYLAYQKDLDKDSFGSNFGSQFIGNMGAYLSDPVSIATLTTELGALKLIKPLASLAMKSTRFDRALANMYGDAELWGPTIEKAGEYTKIPMKRTMEQAQNKIAGYTKDELVLGAGMEGTIGGNSEALQQEGTYKFKHEVLPEFTPYERDMQIGVVAGSSGLLPFVGTSIGHILTKKAIEKSDKAGRIAAEEVENIVESSEGAMKAKAEKGTKEGTQSLEELEEQKVKIEAVFDELQQCFVNEKNGIDISSSKFNQRKRRPINKRKRKK